ncbi:MAG: PAS domain S-box protein [Deltaproteobacteria bacterium]|nr:PAS domain S-box protein [Deltaproteobacteria bacterium]
MTGASALPPAWVRSPLRVALGVLGLGLCLSGLAASWQARENEAVQRDRFDAVSQRARVDLVDRLARYEYGLRGARGVALIVGPDQLDLETFERYARSRDIDVEFPGARGMGIIRRVAAEDEAGFVEAARRAGQPDFAIHQLDPHDGPRYLIQFVEPIDRNRQAVGLDIASEERRREAADAAGRDGAARLTAPITLVQATGKAQRSFLLLLPIYRMGGVPTDPDARAAALIGWAYAPLVIDEVLAGFDFAGDQIAVTLYDVSPRGSATEPFFSSGGAISPAERLRQRVDVALFGRQWAVETVALPGFVPALRQSSPLVLGGGLGGLAVVCAILTFVSLQGARRAALARAERARQAAILQSSSDAIIGTTLEGVITDWNNGAERLFGIAAADAIGRPEAELLPAAAWPGGADVSDVIERGATLLAVEAVVPRGGSDALDVLVTTSPMVGPDGAPLGIARIVRDIGPAKRVERQARDLNAELERQVVERTALLEAARRDLQNILDAVPVLITYWDNALRNRFCNQISAQWFGVEAERLPGMHASEALGAHAAEFLPWMELALEGVPSEFQASLPGADGEGERHTTTHLLPDQVNGVVRGFYAIMQDITSIKRNKLQLEANTAVLRRAEEVAGVGGWELEVGTGALTWSAQTRRIHEVDPDYEPVLDAAIRFYTPEARRVIEGVIAEAMGGRGGWDVELPLITARGRAIWVRAVGMAIFEDGVVRSLVGTFQDVTERRAARIELQEANARFESATAAAAIAVWEWSVADDQLVWDDRMLHLHDLDPAEGGGTFSRWVGRVHADDQERFTALMRAALRGEAQFDLEFRVVARDGDERHLKAAARVVRDPAGGGARVMGVCFDITAPKRAENALRQTTSLLRDVLDSASEISIIATTPDLTITVFNRGAEQLLGYTSAEIVGRTTPILIHDPAEVEERAAQLSAELGRPVIGGEVFIEPSRLRRPFPWVYVARDGRRVNVSLVVTAILGREGEVVGYLGVAHDITREVQTETSLREAKLRAEQANVAKSQFLANMSHEIRTPLNAVLGLSQLLQQTRLDADQADILGKIRVAGAGLLEVINDVLDLSKIEAGELEVEAAPFRLTEIVDGLADLMTTQATAKGICFFADVQPGLPKTLRGDGHRLRQILTNLLSNAIKFTERGSVTLRVSALSRAGGALRLRFAVRDTGIGIAPEAQARVFDAFAQADTSTTRRFGGTGLGLSIVKHLVGLMGGTVGVASAVDEGSEFWADLQFEVAADQVEAAAAAGRSGGDARALEGLRILAVDDSEINLEIAQRLLEHRGARVTRASDGVVAIATLRAATAPFDAVLMDIQMPRMDGYEATRCIRRELGLTRLPILAVTAGVLVSERQRALDAGMDGFVGKPFSPDELVGAILGQVGAGGAGARGPTVAAPDLGWPEVEGIDAADVQERLGGDAVLFRALLRRFLIDMPDVQTAPASASDLPGLKQRLHAVRGAAGALGAREVYAEALDAEAHCAAGDTAAAAGACERVAAGIERVRRSAAGVLTAGAA